MILTLAVTVGMLVQAAAKPEPVRVWRTDSLAYVSLRQPGDLLVLHVDAIGRIQVLFPASPDDGTAMLANDTLVVIPLPPTAEGNPATFIAVRSRWAFDFASLRMGSEWDYGNAWLLQPTAGDPLAAVLDIADRVTDERPYDYGVAAYSRSGIVLARNEPLHPDVCLSCVRRREPVAVAAAVATNSVDCSNASLTNSFCGINSGNVSITSAAPAESPPQMVYQPAPAAPVYVPYFLPMAHGFRRRFETPPPAAPAPRSQGVAYPIAPRLVVPSRSELRTFTGRRP